MMMAKALTKSRPCPRPVFSVIERSYRNRKVAEEVSAGRFTHINITLELGVEPDWLSADLPPDEEWRIEWSKFYYGLELAHAFLETGDHKFLRTWESLVRSWIRQVPIGFDTSDVAGRRIQNWIYAWGIFARSPRFARLSVGLDEEIVQNISFQVDHLRNNLTAERNHRTLELYALFIAALALPEIDPLESLLRFAVDQLQSNLLTDIRPDGVHRENSTHYHMMVLRSFLGARENARRFGLKFSAEYDRRLERACEFAMHCHRPNGSIPALSDGDTGNYGDLLELAASIFSRPDFLYAATAGLKGITPRHRYLSFPEGGYYIQRSGWGEGKDSFRNERFLVFDCGPLGDGGHGHYDLLNVEMAAYNRSLVLDPGRYTYSQQPPNWRRWFKGTAAHNTVTIDRLDQTPYSRGKPKGRVAEGRLIERLSAPDFDVLSGEARSPAYEAVHTRRVFFVAGRYWIIADYLRGEIAHRFDLRFHLSPEWLDRVEIQYRGRNVIARTPDCAYAWDFRCRPKIEPGWYAPFYGLKVPAPVLSVSVEGVEQAAFYTLVYPLTPDQQAPGFRLLSDRNGPEQTSLFKIRSSENGKSFIDLVAWSGRDEPLSLDPFLCRASAAWVRKSDEQSAARISACNLRELSRVSSAQEKLVEASRSLRWITWDEETGLKQDEGREP